MSTAFPISLCFLLSNKIHYFEVAKFTNDSKFQYRIKWPRHICTQRIADGTLACVQVQYNQNKRATVAIEINMARYSSVVSTISFVMWSVMFASSVICRATIRAFDCPYLAQFQ